MTRDTSRRWRWVFALCLPLAMIAAACADDDNGGAQGDAAEEEAQEIEVGAGSGDTVTMTGPEVEPKARVSSMPSTRSPQQTGIEIQYQGTRDFEAQIGVRVDGGDPPDVAMFPQPGRIREFADEGALVPLAPEVSAEVQANMDPQLVELVTVDGQLLRRSRPRRTSRAWSGTARRPSPKAGTPSRRPSTASWPSPTR